MRPPPSPTAPTPPSLPKPAGPLRPAGRADDRPDAVELLERQAVVLELIAGNAPLPEILTEIITSLERLMPGARCSVLLLDRERGTLHHGAAPSLPPAYVATVDGLPVGDGAGSCGTAAALNTAVVVADVREDPRWVDFRRAAERAALRSCWSTPIAGRDGSPAGTFAVYHGEPHRPTRREQVLLDRFTHLASVAIDHAGLLRDLVDSEERFRRSFDDNSLGMAILGPDHTVASANTALSDLARGRGDLVGSRLADLVTPAGPCLATRLGRLDDTAPSTFTGLLHRPGPHGPEGVEVEVTVSLLRGGDGSPTQYVVNVLDLTERRASERDRRARVEADTARRTAEELSRAKSDLLAAVGHEARTPMQAIVGFAELLGTIDLDEGRRREALRHIEAAAGHVMDLLTDVLDLSRLEVGALPLHPEPVRLRDTVTEVYGLLSAEAAERGTTLSHTLDEQVVSADPRRLRQVLLNLVGNAVRHGRADGRVRVRAEAPPGSADVAIRVEDDGPGIPSELRPLLFTPFARTRPAVEGTPAHEDSIGLGLGLARGLARAMEGSLDLAGTGPTGTCMVLRLPRPDASPDARPHPDPPVIHHERGPA